ncbi:MAG: hypothetical protein JWO31_3599 [Phycisphaerales bacterium]|nr:hypothetical protein [Phycisphaerales bacterium]
MDCGLQNSVCRSKGGALPPDRRVEPPLAASRTDRVAGSAAASRRTSFRAGRFGASALLLVPALLAPGCIAGGKSRPPEQRVTWVPKEQGEPQYHMALPAAATVSGTDFDALWQAIYRETRNAGFIPDREDYRLGVFTTRPVVSAQLFEPWRRDTGTWFGLVQNTLATIRRTLRWDVVRADDGTITATPRVLIERYSVIEHRVTFSAEYAEIFALTREEAENVRLRALDPAAFVADPVPVSYWYSIGRDQGLEERLAAGARGRVQ